MSWHGQVEELLYEGESVQETVEMGASSVVVTSHRVLAFTPNSDGANFDEVQRPNVAGISTSAQAETSLLEQVGQIAVIGAVLLGAGWVLDFGAMLGTVSLSPDGAATGQLGIGGVLGPLQTMLDVLRNLDYYLFIGGGLAMGLALLLLGVYVWQRDRTLAIEVAGGEDIHVPRPDKDSDAVARLERAIAPRPGGDASTAQVGSGGLVDDRGSTDPMGGDSEDPFAGGSPDPLADDSDDPFGKA